MNAQQVTRDALGATARRILQPGITPEQALLLAYAELTAEPLDAWAFDDAAVLLRAERLLVDGLPLPEALSAARDELVRFATLDNEGRPT